MSEKQYPASINHLINITSRKMALKYIQLELQALQKGRINNSRIAKQEFFHILHIEKISPERMRNLHELAEEKGLLSLIVYENPH